jgi:hypothetical protein
MDTQGGRVAGGVAAPAALGVVSRAMRIAGIAFAIAPAGPVAVRPRARLRSRR